MALLCVPGGDLDAAGEAEFGEDVSRRGFRQFVGRSPGGRRSVCWSSLGEQFGNFALAAGQARGFVNLAGLPVCACSLLSLVRGRELTRGAVVVVVSGGDPPQQFPVR